jgi:hypothetical protein
VLTKGGLFICVTFRQPIHIKPLLNPDNVWDVEVMVLHDEDGNSFDYHALILSRAAAK